MSLKGKIIKGISGFYYIHVVGAGIYECKAKGIFRKQKIKPLVGDDALIDVIKEEKNENGYKTGNLVAILPRRKELIRPAVSNIDMALVVFAAKHPDPNLNLLDRFLCMMEFQKVPSIICFNKCDLVGEEEKEKLRKIYEPAGYPVYFLTVAQNQGVDEIREIIKGKTATLAGPSGVGKSSLVNALQPDIQMETGQISQKIDRGKHTTRHAEIIPVENGSYIMDTPGFSSMDLPGFEKEELWTCYPEFRENMNQCRFMDCNHMNEPGCAVKEAVEKGKISRIRYDNYKLLYTELKNAKKVYNHS